MQAQEKIETGQPEQKQLAAESNVSVRSAAPQGVIPPNLKLYIVLGMILALLIASAISSLRQQPVKPKPTPSMLLPQEPDTARITDFGKTLKDEIAQQRQKAPDKGDPSGPQLPNATTAQAESTGAAQLTSYGAQSGASQTPAEQQREALAEQEREMAFKSRFASNLVVSQSRSATTVQAIPSSPNNDGALAQTNGPQQTARSAQPQHPAEVSVNSAVGQPYVLYEGTLIDTVLMNRLDGDEPGPVKVLVTNPVYSHDRQHILIPDGSVVLGEARKIGNAGFGQQRRMALVFHRLLMPDGYSLDLDQFQGLDQIGEAGIKDKVNNHYFEIFGASIALGIVSAGAESSAGNAGAFTSGADALKSGLAASLSQSGTSILDKFLNIPPTLTIREGHRIKVYISQDMLLPAVEHHTIPPNI